jgi:hypothetical protein
MMNWIPMTDDDWEWLNQPARPNPAPVKTY